MIFPDHLTLPLQEGSGRVITDRMLSFHYEEKNFGVDMLQDALVPCGMVAENIVVRQIMSHRCRGESSNNLLPAGLAR